MSATADKTHVADEVESVPGAATHEAIAARAYEIYSSGTGDDAVGNWLRAEIELGARADADTQLDPQEEEEEEVEA